MELRAVSVDGIETERLKLAVVQVCDGDDLQIAKVFITNDHTPIQRHLNSVWTDLQICRWCGESFKKDEGNEKIVNVLLIAIIQNTVTKINRLGW
jgi:hypothetical protein